MSEPTKSAEPLRVDRRGSVAAVVTTFNRREKLERTIDSLRAGDIRPDAIVLVNNASTDGTDEYLATIADDEDIVILDLAQNVGGAGGFAAGLQEAWRLGHDWMWIMDDDCYPEPASLRRLLEEHLAVEEFTGKRVSFSCSVVKYIDGNLCEMNEAITHWDWPRYLIHGYNSVRVRECTFVSVMFPREVVERIGLPIWEYFIWWDDKEYTKRAVRAFGPGLQVLDSLVIHDMGVNRGVDYGRITDGDLWKFRRGARNQSSYRWHYEGEISYAEYTTRVRNRMNRARLPQHIQDTMNAAMEEGKTFNPQPLGVRDTLPWDEPEASVLAY